MKKKAARKKKPKLHSQRPQGFTQVLGRVNPNFAAFVWGLTDEEIASAANSISKHIEISYQMELLRSSGFGHEDDL